MLFTEEAAFSSACVLGIFLRNHLVLDERVFSQDLYSAPLLQMAVFMLIPRSFYYYSSTVYMCVCVCISMYIFTSIESISINTFPSAEE